ncbi:hypothetical protein O9G_005631 [Rozella allomycis CSF55]|uniref:Uncharacterized protein n=1 Tax=Rozella allomycis (strain CSF55) TaxID=988480 RepID=A0A075AVD4_ROZAC|nr:hypothetical protein O9G_005631 [Rozella allomycis CSF55]|eukprot:EPZ34075.1 hypothetical protein O9G_005631 [Rozella allomycis CSF55]
MPKFSIKIFSEIFDNQPIAQYQVPVVRKNITYQNLDYTLVKVIKLINGVDWVKKLAKNNSIDNVIFTNALHHLRLSGIVSFIDIFRFSNVYQFSMSHVDRDRFKLTNTNFSAFEVGEMKKLSYDELTNIFKILGNGQNTVKDTMREYHGYIHDLNVDVRQIVAFGVLCGVLQRKHRYYFVDREWILDDEYAISDQYDHQKLQNLQWKFQ